MSTNIYYAYRISIERFNEGLKLFHEVLLNKAIELTKVYIDDVSENEVRERYNLTESDKITLGMKIQYFSNFLSKSYRDDKCDLISCGYNIWFHDDNMVYFVPWGTTMIVETLEDYIFPNWIEEYYYYNSSDKPENISNKEWKQRKKKWDEILGNGHSDFIKYKLVHEIATSSNWSGTLMLFSEYNKRYTS